MTDNSKTVLVTGGSGYVAGWVIAQLLDTGHSVRATIRDTNRADAAKADIASVAKDIGALEFVNADLLSDEGWHNAMKGVSAVMHIASPVMARRGEDTIRIAVEGTRRVLNAATQGGIDRVVVTSSGAAARAGLGLAGPANEQVWTDLDAPGVSSYARSKTLAEQVAWDFARQHSDGPHIATVLPAFVQGPLLGRNASASLSVVGQMLNGKMPAAPHLGFSIIDVRDLADLHVRVLDDPKGMGERWIASSDFLWLSDIATTLRERLGPAAMKVPTRTMPNWLFRIIALANADMKPMVPDLGVRRVITSEKAKGRLNWHPRSSREAVIATAESLLKQAP